MLTKLNEELMKFRKGGMYEGMFPERWLPAVVGILPEPLTAQNGTVNSTSKVVRHKVYEVFGKNWIFFIPLRERISGIPEYKEYEEYDHVEDLIRKLCEGKQLLFE